MSQRADKIKQIEDAEAEPPRSASHRPFACPEIVAPCGKPKAVQIHIRKAAPRLELFAKLRALDADLLVRDPSRGNDRDTPRTAGAWPPSASTYARVRGPLIPECELRRAQFSREVAGTGPAQEGVGQRAGVDDGGQSESERTGCGGRSVLLQVFRQLVEVAIPTATEKLTDARSRHQPSGSRLDDGPREFATTLGRHFVPWKVPDREWTLLLDPGGVRLVPHSLI